jgi:large subunit ribosomal protein L28
MEFGESEFVYADPGRKKLIRFQGPIPKILETPSEVLTMAMMCEMCGKKPVFGNRISHAHNVSSRRWLPNVQRIRVKVGTAVQRMRVCTRCIRSGKIQKAVR